MIVESKRLVPCCTSEEVCSDRKDFIVYCSKPANFIKMVKCEDDDKNNIQFEVLELEIKIIVNELKPVTIYYEVSENYILNQLKEICKC